MNEKRNVYCLRFQYLWIHWCYNILRANTFTQVETVTWLKVISSFGVACTNAETVAGQCEPRFPLTWLTRCWNGGADGSRRSRSVCNANSVRAFQGGWYDCTSMGLRPRGLSWRTGLDATIGMPCMLPYPNFLPSCNNHVNCTSQVGVIFKVHGNQRTEIITFTQLFQDSNHLVCLHFKGTIT